LRGPPLMEIENSSKIENEGMMVRERRSLLEK
jgi:hypothetical protein